MASQDTVYDIQKIIANGVTSIAFSFTQDELDQLASDVLFELGNSINHMTYGEVIQYIVKKIVIKASSHEKYETLAVSIYADYLHSITASTFSGCIEEIHDNSQFLDEEFYQFVKENAAVLNEAIKHDNDRSYPYRGYVLMERSYLWLREDRTPFERPQYMLMRAAAGVMYKHTSVAEIVEMYCALSAKEISLATPILFNSGSKRPNLISCFLSCFTEDSIEGIEDTHRDCALMAKSTGGIGLCSTNIRPRGSLIKTVNRPSNGVCPMLTNFNVLMKYVDQGRRRAGALANYMEAWHSDVDEWLNLKTMDNRRVPVDEKCANLFYGLWCPRLLFERAISGEKWSYFDSSKYPALMTLHGDEFEKLYTDLEKQRLWMNQVPARDLLRLVAQVDIEIGMPYLHNKDLVNYCSNQKNLGTIRCSNLCAEILEYSDSKEIACCNLSSINLMCLLSPPELCSPRDVHDIHSDPISYTKLAKVMRLAVRFGNYVIDTNLYALDKMKKSNLRHRPIGVGVQAFSNLLEELMVPMDSKRAQEINCRVFETMYYAGLKESCELAKIYGSYQTFIGSPASQGKLHFDLYEEYMRKYHSKWVKTPVHHSNRYDWDSLRTEIKEHGLRNSLLMAQMPTQTTALILGNVEATYPRVSNVYVHRTKEGEFVIPNYTLMRQLQRLGLWNEQMLHEIILNKGSIQQITRIPEHIRHVFKTSFEWSSKKIIKLSTNRQAWIDQGQSHDNYIEDPTTKKVIDTYMYAFKKGAKTIKYYSRTNAAAQRMSTVVAVDKEAVVTEPSCAVGGGCTA